VRLVRRSDGVALGEADWQIERKKQTGKIARKNKRADSKNKQKKHGRLT
jgi:hypothetical protein